MLVYDFVPVQAPFEQAEQWARAGQSVALAAAGALAFDCPEADGRLENGIVRSRHDALVLDVRWTGNAALASFDYFEGEIQFAPLSGPRSHLSLSASYEPAGGGAITSPERVRSHRETEVRVREFLAIVAMQLEQAEAEQ
jgi:hypothetical protein